MITKCECTPEARAMLTAQLGIAGSPEIESVEVEFKEVPYFIVSRSREKWSEERGDINSVLIMSASERGLVVDPDSNPIGVIEGISQSRRHTMIPWSNILSVTVTRVTEDR